MPVRPVETEPKTETCQCGKIKAPRLYEIRGRCVIECGATIEKKHVFCRPCALGNHTGKPCRRYVREGVFHFTSTRTCKDCGFDSALHEEGHDGERIA